MTSAVSGRTGWKMGLGAEARPDGVFFRIWAPKRRSIEVVLEDTKRAYPLAPEDGGYFSGTVPEARAGSRYRYRLDGGDAFPDPCSRWQPDGPHGPSAVVDPDVFRWTDAGWRGLRMKGQVFYELHVGSFTHEGTFDAVIGELDELKAFGVTSIELMPLTEFPGRWNWGYDGVGLYAPAHVYGGPEGLKRLVDAAHAKGLGVIHDVVYNHIGPDGNYLGQYSDDYFSKRHTTDWGDAINYDGPNSTPVREFFVRNAAYWIAEYHLDGLRLDATQNIYDDGPVHVIVELAGLARESAAARTILIVAENEPNDARCILPVEDGGFGLDGVWNDDFHHSARVALTGKREAYYTDYTGTPQEIISAVKRGFLYQGQYYAWQKQNRGTSVPFAKGEAFVTYLLNHDQIANSLFGERLYALSGFARYRAMAAIVLLGPGTPLFFMGQEFGASAPFVFFADHNAELASKVRAGRRDFLKQFASCAGAEALGSLDAPDVDATFEKCRLDFSERLSNAGLYAYQRELLALRRDDAVIAAQDRLAIDGAVLGPQSLLLRWAGEEKGDRLLIVNLGGDFDLTPASEPLLAPPAGMRWRMKFSSDEVRFGGQGSVNPCGAAGWKLSATSAVFFSSESEDS